MLEIVQAGGWLMLPIIACSVIAAAIILERLWTLQEKRVLPKHIVSYVREWMQHNELEPEHLQQLHQSSPLGQILAAGLASRGLPRDIVRERIEDSGRHVVHELERYLNPLHTIASISPLLGLLGTVIGMVPVLRRYSRTTVEFLRPIPSVAIIPLAILMFGLDRDASLVIVVYATFWQIFIQVLYGVADVDPVARDTQRSFGISTLDRFRHLVLPTALPYLMTGIRLGATVALILTVTGELLIGADGIGRLLTIRQTAGDYAGVYALVVTAGLLALVINLIVRLIERRVLAWHQSVRAEVVL